MKNIFKYFFSFRSEQIAQQLTLIDANLYQRVEASEFVISSMGDVFDREKVPNFALCVDHFNALSYWTQGIILSQNSSEGSDYREKLMWKVRMSTIYLKRASLGHYFRVRV